MAELPPRPPDRAEAFAQYYAGAHPRVLRAIALVLGDPEHAARIAHESFVRTHAAWRRVGDHDPFLHTIRCAFRLAWRVRPGEPAGNVGDTRAAATPLTAVATAAGGEARDIDLGLALAALPRAARVVLVFSCYLGLDDTAIARVMGEREADVVAHREQAQASLRTLLGEERTGVA